MVRTVDWSSRWQDGWKTVDRWKEERKDGIKERGREGEREEKEKQEG